MLSRLKKLLSREESSWCSRLSRESNTLKVSSSNLDDDIAEHFAFCCYTTVSASPQLAGMQNAQSLRRGL